MGEYYTVSRVGGIRTLLMKLRRSLRILKYKYSRDKKTLDGLLQYLRRTGNLTDQEWARVHELVNNERKIYSNTE